MRAPVLDELHAPAFVRAGVSLALVRAGRRAGRVPPGRRSRPYGGPVTTTPSTVAGPTASAACAVPPKGGLPPCDNCGATMRWETSHQRCDRCGHIVPCGVVAIDVARHVRP